MLSAVIHSRHSYGAALLAEQLPHQRTVLEGPLVLSKALLKNRRLHQIGDQPVSRMLSTVTNSTDCNFIPHAAEWGRLTFSLYGLFSSLGIASLGLVPPI